ncbi:MAG: hypothetical protein PHX43_06120, partial [Alphaproteobacteria bacterium]|nr:hypothetical protein [Alphaproteobacteria bacterium]
TQMRLKQNGLLNDPFKSASFQKQLSLAGDLHEMRHLLQVTTSEYGAVEKFYNEMDADIFARDVLRQSEACADLMEARHHMRYLDMLVCQRKYLFPPVIDAIEKRRCDPSVSIPTFEEVVQSVAVLRKSLAAYPALVKNGRADTDFSLRLSVLFKIAQNETFSNPLARDIFLKIQDAAEYFCPGISQERGLPVRKDKTSSGISQKFPAVQVG